MEVVRHSTDASLQLSSKKEGTTKIKKKKTNLFRVSEIQKKKERERERGRKRDTFVVSMRLVLVQCRCAVLFQHILLMSTTTYSRRVVASMLRYVLLFERALNDDDYADDDLTTTTTKESSPSLRIQARSSRRVDAKERDYIFKHAFIERVFERAVGGAEVGVPV